MTKNRRRSMASPIVTPKTMTISDLISPDTLKMVNGLI